MANEEYHKHDETNRLIAEFMGLETVVRHPRTGEWTEAHFDFHHSWDCLMPVIHKIGQMEEFDYEPFDSVSLYSSIELVYESVVEAVEWYNENKQQ